MVELVEEDNRRTVVAAEEEANVTGDRMIHLLVIAVGCVAIWPVTVPKMYSLRGILLLFPPEVNSLNPGSKAQEDVAENAQSDLVGLTYCMMETVTSILWMMLVSCTFRLLRTMLWAFSSLRRKLQKNNK